MSQINKPNKDRKLRQCIYKTTNGAVSELIREAETCMFVMPYKLSLCLSVSWHVSVGVPPSVFNPPPTTNL